MTGPSFDDTSAPHPVSGVVVAGMHRSGTSLMTALIAAGGWHPGEELLTGPIRPDGRSEEYFEDASVVALHRTWLADALPPDDLAAPQEEHRDWGVTANAGDTVDLGRLPAEVRSRHETAAGVFAARRRRERSRWVAKDPRATLFLPTWAAVDGLRFVLVYRNPWDVVDSAVRLGADVFCRRPRIALAAWLDHNRRLLDFATTHRDRCTVVAAEALTLDQTSVWALLSDAIGLDGPPPDDLVDTARFVRRTDDHAVAGLYRDVYPHHVAVLDALDAVADLPRRRPPPPGGPTGGPTGGPPGGPLGTPPGQRPQPPPPAPPGGTLPPGTGVQVVVPCRDDGDFLVEAVASVEACAHPRLELTIVDDGSTDAETLRVLDALRSTGRQVITTPGVGLAAARNAGAAGSRTCAVLPLDADNRVRPPLLDALDNIEVGDVDVVHGPWRRFGMDDTVVTPPDITLDALLPGNTVDGCALLRRDLLDRLGGWDTALPFWEDWDLWLGAVTSGARMVRLDDVTFDYLVRPGALNELAADPTARLRVVAHVMARHRATLGPTVTRLVEQVHAYDLAREKAERRRTEAETALERLAGERAAGH